MIARIIICYVVMLLAASTNARRLRQDDASMQAGMRNATAVNATATYPSLADALTTANTTAAANLTILMAAINASGVAPALNESTAWTIFAPNDAAFEKLLTELNTTAQDLLANQSLLTEVLSYHVIPEGAVSSSSLAEGQNLTTALAGAPPLMVMLNTTNPDGSGIPLETPRVELMGPVNSAAVIVPDIVAGQSIVHVVDAVLVPPSLAPAPAPMANSTLAGY